MARFATIVVLSLVLCIVGARSLKADCCFVWTEYGWSACVEGIDQDSCAKIKSNQGWYQHYYIERDDCKCLDNLPYYREPVFLYDEWIPAIYRYVIVSTCYGDPEEGEWDEYWSLGKGWSNLDIDSL